MVGPMGAEGGSVKIWKGWWALMGLGQENLLGFLLFWIGGYALIHGEDTFLVGLLLDELTGLRLVYD